MVVLLDGCPILSLIECLNDLVCSFNEGAHHMPGLGQLTCKIVLTAEWSECWNS